MKTKRASKEVPEIFGAVLHLIIVVANFFHFDIFTQNIYIVSLREYNITRSGRL